MRVQNDGDNPYIEVLETGFVRLVDHMGTDLSVVRSARVSYNADWRTGEDEGKDEKLIKYMLENRHHSPFESVTFTFEVKAPIFIFRQWHRHRTQSYNEVSARYTELDEGFYVPAPTDIGRQDTKNKQSRIRGEATDIEALAAITMVESCKAAFSVYQSLLASGIPREIARSVLPVAAYSRMFTTANLRNWLHFLSLRNDPHAQWEIQQYAQAIEELITLFVPITMKYFQQYRSV